MSTKCLRNCNQCVCSDTSSTGSNEIFRGFVPQIIAACGLYVYNFESTGIRFVQELINAKFNVVKWDDWPDILDNFSVVMMVGNLVAAVAAEHLGRRTSIILWCLLKAIAWLLLICVPTMEMTWWIVYALGFITMAMRLPLIIHFAEICEPSIRSTLIIAGVAIHYSSFFVTLKIDIDNVFVMPTIYAISLVLAAVVMYIVPESPIWLLAHSRRFDAQMSLHWHRGRTTVQDEFSDLQRHCANATACRRCHRDGFDCQHPPAIWDKLCDLLHYRTLMPTFLYILTSVLLKYAKLLYEQMTSSIYSQFNAQHENGYMDSTDAFAALGSIFGLILIRLIGKRKVFLFSAFGAIAISFAFGLSLHQSLPDTRLSADNNIHMFMYPFQVILNIVLGGVCVLPGILIFELFPFKSRAYAVGMASAFNTGITRILDRYNDVQFTSVQHGVASRSDISFFTGFIFIIGFIFAYLFLPETENRTLEEIEEYFSDKKRERTDINIPLRIYANRIPQNGRPL